MCVTEPPLTTTSFHMHSDSHWLSQPVLCEPFMDVGRFTRTTKKASAAKVTVYVTLTTTVV